MLINIKNTLKFTVIINKKKTEQARSTNLNLLRANMFTSWTLVSCFLLFIVIDHILIPIYI